MNSLAGKRPSYTLPSPCPRTGAASSRSHACCCKAVAPEVRHFFMPEFIQCISACTGQRVPENSGLVINILQAITPKADCGSIAWIHVLQMCRSSSRVSNPGSRKLSLNVACPMNLVRASLVAPSVLHAIHGSAVQRAKLHRVCCVHCMNCGIVYGVEAEHCAHAQLHLLQIVCSTRAPLLPAGQAFYRAESAQARDLAMLAAAVYRDETGHLEVLETMCGCGGRAARYLNQVCATPCLLLVSEAGTCLLQQVMLRATWLGAR